MITARERVLNIQLSEKMNINKSFSKELGLSISPERENKMNYIVLDMEWNMGTWNRAKRRRDVIRDPIYLRGEIIQIGAVKLDENLNYVDSFDALIKPNFYRVMNKSVERLTLITDDMISKGEDFCEVIKRFKKWCSPDDVLITWGMEDIWMLQDNLEINGMDWHWIPEHYDAQLMFDDFVTMDGRTPSLDYARFKFGIKGRDSHNALNDALNTVDVIRNFEVSKWIEEERLIKETNYENEY